MGVGAGCLLGALTVFVFKPAGQQIGNYRDIPFAADVSGIYGFWSPDGKPIAYP